MARRLSSRRLLWLPHILSLSRQFSTVQSCSPSRLYRAATAFGLNALLFFCRCCAASHLHSSPFSTAPFPSPSLRSSHSISHESPGLLPTSVFSTNSSMSARSLPHRMHRPTARSRDATVNRWLHHRVFPSIEQLWMQQLQN
jgi:hypothetical protein